MYEECVTCQRLGVDCDGPNFIALSSSDLIDWIKARKNHLGLSNLKFAELSNTPKGTIDRLLSHQNVDFKHETARALVKALIGTYEGNPCPNLIEKDDSTESDAVIVLYQKNMIDQLKEQVDSNERIYKDVLAEKRKTIVILSIALGVAVALAFLFLFI